MISLEGWSNYVSTEHKGSEPEKLQIFLVELEEKLVLAVETPGEGGELLKGLVYTGKTRSFCTTPEK